MSLHHAMVDLKHNETLRSCIFLRGFALRCESSSQPWEASSFLVCWLCSMQTVLHNCASVLRFRGLYFQFLLQIERTWCAWFLTSSVARNLELVVTLVSYSELLQHQGDWVLYLLCLYHMVGMRVCLLLCVVHSSWWLFLLGSKYLILTGKCFYFVLFPFLELFSS